MIQLTPRERWLTLVGILLLVGGGFYGFLIKPVRARIQRLYEIIPQKRQELARIEEQGQQFLQLTDSVHQLQARLPDANTDMAPLPHLESLLEVHNLKQQVTTMNQEPPVEEGRYIVTVVQIRLEAITLSALLRFLQDIKDDEVPLHVQTIQLTRGVESLGQLNAALTLNSVALPSLTSKKR
jgi:type II secretory pathway component PulM